MDGLSCCHCKGITNQFTILRCDHVICAECLWGEVKTSLQGVNSIKCKCGVVTKFTSSPSNNSANVTVTTSPRKQLSRHIRTEAATLSVRAPSSPSQSRFTSGEDKPTGELHSELQFLAVQFRKSVEEAERNFKKVVENIKSKYQNLVKNIRMFWFEEVLESKPLTLLELPKLLMRKYQKSVGLSIQRLNEGFLQQLSSFRLQTQPGERISSSTCKRHHQHYYSKENIFNTNTCVEERRKLFQAIEQLKETRGIKKIARKGKPLFQRA